jgi:alpha-D-ribose 1-methylphosphonate 5-triphosphate synthase subunit PhnI
MYIAAKGGEAAIAAAVRLLDEARRGDPALRELEVAQIRSQLGLLVDRVMAEGSLLDPELAALALKQAQGDAIEAAFLLRAYRTTLPRLGFSEPIDTSRMRADRRVSSIFKDLPGGQLLGPTFDYTQRLLDFGLLAASATPPAVDEAGGSACDEAAPVLPCALRALEDAGLLELARPSEGDPEPPDITREPPAYPMNRAARLQMLMRADEGWLLGLGYSTQRGYANSHPFAGEIRCGAVPVELWVDELGFAVEIGEIELTECQMINQFIGSADRPPRFTRGQGLAFGRAERRAMAMALVDRALRADELGEALTSPAQQQEYALPHGDNVEASGFVQHLKLPHHVTFEAEVQMLRGLRAGHERPEIEE